MQFERFEKPSVQIYFQIERENSFDYFFITYITNLQSKFCCLYW